MFASVLKFNKNHGDDGRFTNAGGASKVAPKSHLRASISALRQNGPLANRMADRLQAELDSRPKPVSHVRATIAALRQNGPLANREADRLQAELDSRQAKKPAASTQAFDPAKDSKSVSFKPASLDTPHKAQDYSNTVWSSGQKTPRHGTQVIQHSIMETPKAKKRKRSKKPSEYPAGVDRRGVIWTPGTDPNTGAVAKKSDRLVMSGSMEAGIGFMT